MRERMLGLDLVAVLLFVAIGRRSHDEATSLGGLTRTATPFLIGLLVGWLVSRAWDRPTHVRTGVVVAAVTVSLGMVLRRFVVGDGTATSFVIVASVFITAALVGWRLVYGRVASTV